MNYLEFGLRDTDASAEQVTVSSVRSFLGQPAEPDRVFRPAHHSRWGTGRASPSSTQESQVLVILIVLALLSAAFLLANTIRTMIAEQAGEIGVMRAVGASRRDVRRTYLRTAALLGLAGAAIGVPLGMALAYLLVGMFARLFFGVSPAFGIDWAVAGISVVVGVGGAMLTAWVTLRRSALHTGTGRAEQ